MNGREAAEAAWKDWADRELAAADPDRRARAVEAAMEVLDRGGAQAVAAAAAPALGWLEPRGALTAAGIDEARSQLLARRAAADATLPTAFAAAPRPAPAIAPAPPG